MGTSILDTYATETHPSTNYQGSAKLNMRSAGDDAFPFLLPKGFAVGKDVLTTEAILDIFTEDPWDPCTLTAKRVTSNKAYSGLNFNNKPTVTATGAVAVVLGALAADTKVSINITALVDGWAKGTFDNFGLRLEHNAADSKWMHSSESKTAAFRPRLTATQYRKPSTPQILAPKAGLAVSVARPKLTWVPPTDPMMAQYEYKVQMNQTDVWSAPTYDSGWLVSEDGEHLVTFDIDDGDTWFWRLYIRNEGGQESTVSASQQFNRTAKPTYSIIQPTGGVWTDSTPPVEWSALSAGIQKQFRVQHFVDGVEKIDTGVLTGDDTSWTSERPIPGFASGEVTTRVSLRDDVARVATPGDGIWIRMEETWTYTPGATAPVDTIAVGQHPLRPLPLVTFTRSGSPDRWDIQRSIEGGPWESVAITEGPELHTTGTTYEFVDATAPPYRDIEYRAVAGVNHIDSDDNPTATGRVNGKWIWFLDPADEEFWVALADKDESGLRYTEDSEVAYIKGSAIPQVIFDAFHGFEGTVTGGVYGDASSPVLGRTAQEQRDTFIDRVKKHPTRVLRLVMSDQNIPVIVRNATPILRPNAKLQFGISCDIVQQGELPWS